MLLSARVLLALIGALVVGVGASLINAPRLVAVVAGIEPVGALWVNAIRMTVVPLVVSLLIGGIASGSVQSVGRAGGRALAWFGILAVGAAILAAVAAPPLLRLVQFDALAIDQAGIESAREVTLPPFRDWVVGLIPANPVRAAVDGAMLPLIVFTCAVALAITRLPPEQRTTLVDFFKAIADAMLVIVTWILAVAPVGVFCLVAPLALRGGLDLVGAFGYFVLVASVLVVLASIALYPITAVFGGVSVRRFARACIPVQVVGFSTRSSLASLPAMLEVAERDLRLPGRIAGVTLPVAVALFKYASPTARLTGTFFVAQLYSVELGVTAVVGITAAIALLSFYSPGIPSGGLFILAPIYAAFNLPLEGVGLLIALDLIPDMFITTANVTADLSVAAIVTRSETPTARGSDPPPPA